MTVPPVDRSSAGGPAAVGRPRPAALRVLDGLSGLLTAGMLVTGVVWLIGRLLAPTFVPAAGAAGGTGPWWGIGLHLGVGLTGEVLRRRGRGWSPGLRAAVDLLVTAAVAAVLWSVWAG